MADLTPDEQRALQAAIDRHDGTAAEECVAIWRAARAYQAEQDARICDEYVERDEHGHTHGVTSQHSMILAAAIRERAKGLT